VYSALARLSLRFCYFLDLSTEVLGSYFSGAKAFYFGNSRISQRQKSIYFPLITNGFCLHPYSSYSVYQAPTVDKPYCLSHPSFVIKNASQEKEGNGVMWLEGWPGLQLPFSLTTTQKQQHYWR
jgi:hypothetical protein